MTFMNAVWYLREQGAIVEASNMISKYGRLYLVIDVEDPVPPMWLSTKALCDLADMASDGVFKRK
jgi:hypothetical protein